ncbi:hypothetical protein [Candidatus Odyssella thessalonicensis]|uniref:hypothetical protein n=1 Tax=Candidatus Odyssella thessalonicensis TaxID=84647 RepID=UPI000225BC4C|nr:hypothetical protein [Candidatus Odyssella thessalonicensis]
MTSEFYSHIMSCVWMVANRGLAQLTPEVIANQSGAEPQEIERLFPEQYHILLAMLENIKHHVSLPEVDKRLSPRDQIFEAVMLCFDEAQPYQATIHKLYQEVGWHPHLLLKLIPAFTDFIRFICERYLPAERVKTTAEMLVITGACAYAFRSFVQDSSFDLSATMASLDQALKWGDDLNSRVREFFPW